MSFELTPDQKDALTNILSFIHIPINQISDVAGILYAAAGCGKTFLTRVIVNNVRGTHRVAGIAPTHKARKVLARFLNKDSLTPVKTMTIASLLNKIRSHSYIGTKRYVKGSDSKIHLFDLFLVDEASMITDSDVQLIIDTAFKFKRKVLFIGDKFQIPNPSQKYILHKGVASKRDSAAFKLYHSFGLTTNVRQAEGNPIVGLYTEFRDAIAERREPKFSRKTQTSDDLGVSFYTDRDKWYKALEKTMLQLPATELHNTRVLAYTNDTVRSHNLAVRRMFNRGAVPEVDELLMGYNNIGWPEKIIENSQDYYVVQAIHTSKQLVVPDTNHKYKNQVGQMLTLKETDTDTISIIFIPDLAAAANVEMLQELVKRAEQVNKKKSTKDDFKKYCQLKNKLVFLENVYKYKEEVMGEGEFRTNHPLLFKTVTDMIEDEDDDDDSGSRTVLDNKLTRDVQNIYGNILADRIEDDKPLVGTEKLCDRYCVIERDLDYGYCITSHKSQGSNFRTVFVDEADFDKLRNYWSYDLDCWIDATKEKNQLKYVSFTRPTHSAHVFYRVGGASE